LGEDRIGFQVEQIFCASLPLRAKNVEAPIEADIAALDPAAFFQPQPECGKARLPFRVVLAIARQDADAPHPAVLLRMRGERPRRGRTANRFDEISPSHLRSLDLGPDFSALSRAIKSGNCRQRNGGRCAAQKSRRKFDHYGSNSEILYVTKSRPQYP